MMNIIRLRYTATKYTAVLLCTLSAYIGITAQACRPQRHSEYETFRSFVPASADKDRPVALLLYNPQGCTPCNYILANLFDNPGYTALFGNNSFVVFPAVRPSELADYDRLFKSYGQVEVQYISNSQLYELLQEKDKDKLGGRPRWLGLDAKSKRCICFSLREQYLADSIIHYFKD